MTPADDARRTGQSSFSRGLDVLIAISHYGEISVAELAESLNLPQSTVYRYVRSLRDYGLVEEAQGVYVPGWRLLDIAGHHLTHTKLAQVGAEHLRTLTYQTSETAVLAIRAGSHAICLRQSVSPHPDHYAFRINQLLPLHAGAGSRVLLAFAPRAILDITLQRVTRYTESTPIAPERLQQLVAETRRTGFVVSHGEYQEGAVAVAVPVFVDSELACSLTVAGPRERCDAEEWTRRAVRLLRAQAKELALKLAD